jgi:hypothetical protein
MMEVFIMPSPFPGMDPYLEGHNVWPGVHHRLITAIGDDLASQVAPRYYVDIEQRTYIVEVDREEFLGRPDVAIITAPSEVKPVGDLTWRAHGEEDRLTIAAPLEMEPVGEGGVATAVASVPQTVTLPLFEEVREGYLEIRDAQTHEVVTVIEVLSPTNKVPGEGRREYEAKRRHVLHTLTNLVEIDLLRAGEPMEMRPTPKSDYRILVRAGWEPARARVYAFSLRQPLPEVTVPLRQGEKEPLLALGRLLSEVYDRARYDLRLDYRYPPEPPLATEDLLWADELLYAAGRR